MAVFCSSLISCFPGTLLMYFLNDFGIVSIVPIITGITFVFTFNMRYVSILRSSYFRNLYYQRCLVSATLPTQTSFTYNTIFVLPYDSDFTCFTATQNHTGYYRRYQFACLYYDTLTDRQFSANYCSSLITWCCQHRETN